MLCAIQWIRQEIPVESIPSHPKKMKLKIKKKQNHLQHIHIQLVVCVCVSCLSIFVFEMEILSASSYKFAYRKMQYLNMCTYYIVIIAKQKAYFIDLGVEVMKNSSFSSEMPPTV